MSDLTPFTPDRLVAAHDHADPPGYGIVHVDVEGGVLLKLVRLSGGEDLGLFDDREALDAAAEADRQALRSAR